MKTIYTFLFALISFNTWSQNDTASYYDVNKVVYKKIITFGENVKTIYYDEDGKALTHICSNDERNDFLTRHQKDSLFQRISMALKNNNKEEKQSISFCFNIAGNDISNVRLIDFKVENHTIKEIQRILYKTLKNSAIKSTNACETIVELNYRQYVQHSIYREKKTSGNRAK